MKYSLALILIAMSLRRVASGSQAVEDQYATFLENADQAYDRMHDLLRLLDAYPHVSEGLGISRLGLKHGKSRRSAFLLCMKLATPLPLAKSSTW